MRRPLILMYSFLLSVGQLQAASNGWMREHIMNALCHHKRIFGPSMAFGQPNIIQWDPSFVIEQRFSISILWNHYLPSWSSFGWMLRKVQPNYRTKYTIFICRFCAQTKFSSCPTGKPDASFWGHEWLKHGTCASVLNGLDSENKYFGQGLAWLQLHTMTDLLAKANIVPDQQYNIAELNAGIRSVLDHNPSIHCIHEKHTGEIYLAEIRICFNKELELIDCDGVHFDSGFQSRNGIITNCDAVKPINYPSTVPKHLLNDDEDKTKMVWRFPWVNMYKLVQIVKWFTL